MGAIPDFSKKDKMKVIGIMSGTSIDGVDAALCEIGGGGIGDFSVEMLKFHSEPYSRNLRTRILEVHNEKTATTEKLCRLNFRIGKTFARAAESVIEKAGLEPKDVDLIGSHGQTVAHLPLRSDVGVGATGVIKMGSTLQIGEPAVIVESLQIPVVSNFRTRDIAAFGQGAPLVPYVDYLLFSDEDSNRAVVNLGGISNITYLPAGCKLKEVVAFDAGPGNMLIDGLIQLMTVGKKTYDAHGELASSGRVDGYILTELLKHPYLKEKPPKSTGREEFGLAYAEWIYRWGIRRSVKPTDILRTVTDFTAIALADAYKKFLLPKGEVDDVVVSGGGVLNKTLMDRLRKEFEGIELIITDEIGMPLKAKEAISFAVLARETVLGRPANVPSVTGATGPRVLGQITPV